MLALLLGVVLGASADTTRAVPQVGWKCCSQCSSLFYAGMVLQGACRASGRPTHVGDASATYLLAMNEDGPGQPGWRWCRRCQALFFSGNGDQGACPASLLVTEGHDGSASADYRLVVGNGPSAEPGWRWCRRCQELVRMAGRNAFRRTDPGGSPCPAGGGHDLTASGDYSVSFVPGTDELLTRIGHGSTAAAGRRSLLIVPVDVSDADFAPHRDRKWFLDRFFGASGPSVNGYFDENSDGQLGFGLAAFTSTYVLRDDPATTGADESTLTCAVDPVACPGSSSDEVQLRDRVLDHAAAEGFDFSPFDRNRDGRLTDDELTLVVISPRPRVAGATPTSGACRGVGAPATRGVYGCHVPRSSTVSFCASTVWLDDGVSFTTLTHEMSHGLGTIDLYGPDGACLSQGATLMSCTSAVEEDRQSTHLDPWNKIALGWVVPRFFDLNGGPPTAVFELAAVNLLARGADREPVAIFDSARGLSEFLLLELRSNPGPGPSRGCSSGVFSPYDTTVDGSTLAIWHVNMGPDGRWRATPSIRGSASPDPGVFLYGRSAGALRGLGAADLPLMWLDGTSTGVQVRVPDWTPSACLSRMSVEVLSEQVPPLIASRDVEAAPGERAVLSGFFGVRQGQVLIGVKGASDGVARLESWQPDLLTLFVPPGAPEGAYQVRVRSGGAAPLVSDAVLLRVVPRSVAPD